VAEDGSCQSKPEVVCDNGTLADGSCKECDTDSGACPSEAGESSNLWWIILLIVVVVALIVLVVCCVKRNKKNGAPRSDQYKTQAAETPRKEQVSS